MILDYTTIWNSPIEQGCQVIREAPKKRLGDLRVYDLILDGGKEVAGVQGVYMFFAPDRETCLHVGKNSSAQFVERIPWHFAISAYSWQNFFLKNYQKHNDSPSLSQAALSASDCCLLLLPLPNEVITPSEKFFRAFMRPAFNGFKSGPAMRASVPDGMSIGDAVTHHFSK